MTVFDSRNYEKILKPIAMGYTPTFESFEKIINGEATQKYPPHNVVVEEDGYVLEMAVAGWSREDLVITVEGKTLVVTGNAQGDDREFQYKGIGKRSFKRSFVLQDLEVESADLENGELSVKLKSTLPKPRKIDIMGIDKRELLTED